MCNIGSYSWISINVKPNRKLSKDDIKAIKSKLIGDCGVDSYQDISENKIEFKFTSNHNLEVIKELISFIETFISYSYVESIGDFKTEEISGFDYAQVFIYENKIFFLVTNEQYGIGYTDVGYHLNDLRDNKELYNFYLDIDSFEEDFYKGFYINKFLSSIKIKELESKVLSLEKDIENLKNV